MLKCEGLAVSSELESSSFAAGKLDLLRVSLRKPIFVRVTEFALGKLSRRYFWSEVWIC